MFISIKKNPSAMAIYSPKLAGTLYFLGALQFLFFMNIAGWLDPGYSTSQNFISDLGATCRHTCQIIQPTATIFDSSIIVLGIGIVLGSFLFYKAYKTRLFPILLGIAGLGAIGVGVFPETTGSLHLVVSAITFVFAGLAMLVAYKVQKSPLNFFSVILGIVTLVSLVLYEEGMYFGLGPGGMERIIVFPALFWGLAFGGHLMQVTQTGVPSHV